jgi:DNA-binding NtrC family response regulator
MTAYHDTSTYSAAMRLGAFEYLKKPFDFDQIALTVAQAAAESTGARV